LSCSLNFAKVYSARLDPISEWFAEVWTTLNEIKAVCFMFSRQIHDISLFFFMNVTARYMKTVVMKSRYSFQLKFREILT